MSSHFIVSTKSETPKLYVAQIELSQILEKLRGWTDMHAHSAFVFAPRKITPWGAQLVNAPQEHAELALVSIVRPHDIVNQHMWAWGNEVDDLPFEQAQEKLQSMLDYVDRKRLSITSRNVREEETSERKLKESDNHDKLEAQQ
jgi:hypothetical protein